MKLHIAYFASLTLLLLGVNSASVQSQQNGDRQNLEQMEVKGVIEELSPLEKTEARTRLLVHLRDFTWGFSRVEVDIGEVLKEAQFIGSRVREDPAEISHELLFRFQIPSREIFREFDNRYLIVSLDVTKNTSQPIMRYIDVSQSLSGSDRKSGFSAELGEFDSAVFFGTPFESKARICAAYSATRPLRDNWHRTGIGTIASVCKFNFASGSQEKVKDFARSFIGSFDNLRQAYGWRE